MTIEAPAGIGRSSLARCVGDVDTFVTDHWGRAPMLRKGSDSDNYADLFSLADIDYLVSSTALRSPAFRLVKSGENVDLRSYTRTTSVGPQRVYDAIDVGRVWSHFYAGATIVLQGVQRFWLPLTRFCRDLELALTQPTQTNVYVTPPSSRALGVHYDTHDVFVLQIAGRKQWQVFKRLLAHPLQTQRSPLVEDPGPPLLETQLEPGDCLYIPRGFLHEAESLDETSAHLTVGILAYTWKEVFEEAFAGLDDEVAFREPLPVGFAERDGALASGFSERRDLLVRWLTGIDPERVGERLVEKFWASRTPILHGQLEQLERVGELTDETIVHPRPGCICRLSLDDSAATLIVQLGDRTLTMPAFVEPTLRRLVSADEVAVGDLQDLDEAGRLALVRRLIREGLVEAVR